MNPTKQINKVESISATRLAHSLVSGDPLTILDVRSNTDWRIEADGIDYVSIPGNEVIQNPDLLIRPFETEVIVVCARGISAFEVGGELSEAGLNVKVLEGGMSAWKDLLIDYRVETGVDGLDVFQVQRPGRGCLSYLLAAGGEAIVIDPSTDASHYQDLAWELGARITSVIDTHIHADHISGARALAFATHATLRLSSKSLDRGIRFEHRVTPFEDGDHIPLGDLNARITALPGHTTDMSGIYVEKRVLIGGDSVFAESVARPDLESGDERARASAMVLHKTIRERILSLGDGTILLPGHDRDHLNTGAIAPTVGELRHSVAPIAITSPSRFADQILSGMPAKPENHEAIIAVNSGYLEPDPNLEGGGNSCSAG